MKTTLGLFMCWLLTGALVCSAQKKEATDSVVMDEVTVVAYGLSDRVSFTGAVSTVKGNPVFRDLPVLSFEQALQGRVPGLVVNTTSGQPGAELNLRIRGAGSINASNEPLYVIDGVPVTSGNIAFSPVKNDTKAFNLMSSLHPGDIESITVLKDAAAASLYGSRAANGVILITTKRGQAGKSRFRFKANWGISDWATKNKETLSGEQQHELTYEAYYNEAVLYKKWDEEKATAYAKENAGLYAPLREEYSDWEGELFNRHSVNQNYEFSASGGKGGNLFYASLSYNKDGGMVSNSSMEGFMAKLNLTNQLAENVIVGANLSLSKQHSNVVSEMAQEGNPYYMLRYLYKPNYLIYNEDGSFNEKLPNGSAMTNLVKDRGLDKQISDVFRSMGIVWGTYEFMKGFTLKQSVSYDFILNESTLYWPKNSNAGKITQGLMVKTPQQRHNIFSSTLLNYTRTLKEVHKLDLLAGWEVDDRTIKYVQAKGTNYPGDKLPELENAATPALAASGITNDRLLSFLARVGYGFADRYYFSANYRKDGSSRLGVNSRWGDFWSVSGAWRVNRENFMNDIRSIDNLKIRMSYGVNGTLPNSEYGHLSLLGYRSVYMDEPGSSIVSMANPDLTWEKNCSFNVGLDLDFLERFSLVFDFYNRETKELLQDVPVSMVTGFETTLKNVGRMNNRGVEMDLNAEVFSKTAVKWSTGLVLSHNRNKVKELYGGKDIVDGSRILREGESGYSFWSREWAGVDPETGEEMWVMNTKNSDGTLNRELTKDGNKAQRVIVGKADPNLTGGWRNMVSWKGLELSVLFSFSLGGNVMDDLWTMTDSDGYFPLNTIGVKQWDRWQKPGDKTDVPRRINNYTYGRHASSRHLISTDHIRLKNLSLSYSLPSEITRKAKMGGVRVFFAGTNLLTWAAYDDLDPEQPVAGFTTFAFPNLKTYTFGIEIEI